MTHICFQTPKSGPSFSPKKKVSSSQKKAEPVKQPTQTVTEYVAWCLETFRLTKKRDFKPNPKFMASLKAMGFEDEALVKEALLVTENNASYAVSKTYEIEHTSTISFVL